MAPGDAESWAQFGQLLASRNKFEPALDAYNQYLAINPSDTQVRLETVKLMLKLGRKDEARKQIEIAKSFSGDADEVWEFSAFLYLQDNQIDKAKKEYLSLLGINPKSGRAMYSLGLIEAEQKNWQEAQNWFSLVPEKSPLYLDAQAQNIAAAYYLGKQDQAVEMAQKLIKEHPGKSISWLALAGIYQKQEKYDEGVKLLDDALKSLPEDTEILYTQAMLYSLSGNNDKAVEVAQTALTKKPDDPTLLNFIGYTWADMGQNLDQAENYIKRALDQQPDNGAIIDSLAWVNFQRGKYQDALKLLEQAISKIPDDAGTDQTFGHRSGSNSGTSQRPGSICRKR